MKRLLLVALCGCGRIAFDPWGDAGDSGDDASAGLPAGLVAHYPFEGAASLLVDTVAGNDGTCSAAECPTSVVGHDGAGQALSFDGVDDCVTVSDASQLHLAQLTIAVWIRQTSTGSRSQIAKAYLTDAFNSWQVESDPGDIEPLGHGFVTYDGSAKQLLTASNTITLDTWQHVAVTFDGATKRLYVAGTERNSVGSQPAILYDAHDLVIGCDNNFGVNELFFGGSLDDVQIYDRALDPSEIATLAGQ